MFLDTPPVACTVAVPVADGAKPVGLDDAANEVLPN